MAFEMTERVLENLIIPNNLAILVFYNVPVFGSYSAKPHRQAYRERLQYRNDLILYFQKFVHYF